VGPRRYVAHGPSALTHNRLPHSRPAHRQPTATRAPASERGPVSHEALHGDALPPRRTARPQRGLVAPRSAPGMFGDAGAPPGRRFPRRSVRAPSSTAGGLPSLVRAYRWPLCAALFLATIAVSVSVTAVLMSRGGKRPAAIRPAVSGAPGTAPRKDRPATEAELVAAALLSAATAPDAATGLLAAARAMPAAVQDALRAAGGLETRLRPPQGNGSPDARVHPRVVPDPTRPARPLPASSPPHAGGRPPRPATPTPTAPAADVWGEGAGPATGEVAPVTAPTAAAGPVPADGPAPADPSAARAVLVICYNRPLYLRRALRALLLRLPSYDRPHVYVSQDGAVPSVTAAVAELEQEFAASAADVPFTHLRHPQSAAGGDDSFGYMKLARHFGWALGRVFGAGHPRVIVVEDDLEVGADFFEYFSAVAPLLDSDESLLAASAYNDIGQDAFVSDAARVLRSDFFPGLGWMLNARAWAELGPKWPRGYWDDWLREPAQRKGRAFLRPEVSRTRTFGEEGVSRAQFFHRYLSNIRLADQKLDWRAQDLAYLRRVAYDRGMEAAVAAAGAASAAAAVAKQCPAAGGRAGPPWSEATRAAARGAALRVEYGGVDAYPGVAGAFGFIADVKAGVPRTAYRGVVAFRHKGCHVYLVPQGGSPLPAEPLRLAA